MAGKGTQLDPQSRGGPKRGSRKAWHRTQAERPVGVMHGRGLGGTAEAGSWGPRPHASEARRMADIGKKGKTVSPLVPCAAGRWGLWPVSHQFMFQKSPLSPAHS